MSKVKSICCVISLPFWALSVAFGFMAVACSIVFGLIAVGFAEIAQFIDWGPQ